MGVLRDYDNWQDTYGFDAVMAAYHSGHGSMDGAGNFYAAMGGNWGGLGTNAVSSSMKLGNEQVRYIFWSTCFSLRVLDGHNPIRSWNNANLGFRMLFGYETASVDAPNYGSDFWKQWNGNKSFSQAFLDMSCTTFDAPGARPWSRAARPRRKRTASTTSGSSTGARRAGTTGTGAGTTRRLRRWRPCRQPARCRSASPPRSWRSSPPTGRAIRGILDRVPAGVPSSDAPVESRRRDRARRRRRHLAVDPTARTKRSWPHRTSRAATSCGSSAAIRKAHDVVRQFGLDRNQVTFDRVLHKYDRTGTTSGSGAIGSPRLCETVVQFTQLIDGVPVIGPGDGKVSVTLDNDQNVTAIVDRTRTSPSSPTRSARRRRLTR